MREKVVLFSFKVLDLIPFKGAVGFGTKISYVKSNQLFVTVLTSVARVKPAQPTEQLFLI